jgi:hypothetical protein
MTSPSEAQQKCAREIHRSLLDWAGNVKYQGDANEDTLMFVLRGPLASTVVRVESSELADPLVMVHSRIVKGAEINSDLCEFLLRTNANILLGSFAISDDGDIAFMHSFLHPPTEDELSTVIAVMAYIAEEYVGQIISIAGGEPGESKI